MKSEIYSGKYLICNTFFSLKAVRYKALFSNKIISDQKPKTTFLFVLFLYISLRFLDTRAHQVQEEGSRGTEGSSTRENCPRACSVSKYSLLLRLYFKGAQA
jgi:hypothetical protein